MAQRQKGQDYHNYFDEWHERDLVNFCHRDRNHPSVIAWSTGNEVPEQGNKTCIASPRTSRTSSTGKTPPAR